MLLEEVRAEYRWPLGTLRHWIRLGRLPSFRIGRRRFVLRSDVEQMIADAIEHDRAKHKVAP
ncbi:MAG: Helix-turn-helix domain [Myxococcaceae bacterium]|nr:Helix-turn-helix domain [Myxococcaceae bacterium]